MDVARALMLPQVCSVRGGANYRVDSLLFCYWVVYHSARLVNLIWRKTNHHNALSANCLLWDNFTRLDHSKHE